MESKIINMAERLKDESDAKLEAMFNLEPVRDDGFSVQVVGRIQRKMMIRRWALPVAVASGFAAGIKPLLELANLMPGVLGSLPFDWFSMSSMPFGDVSQVTMLMTGIAALGTIVLIGHVLEEA